MSRWQIVHGGAGLSMDECNKGSLIVRWLTLGWSVTPLTQNRRPPHHASLWFSSHPALKSLSDFISDSRSLGHTRHLQIRQWWQDSDLIIITIQADRQTSTPLAWVGYFNKK